jgi:hypothetical protein
MGARQMTGLWTQRSPYRDAAVPYLYSKFYSASRFDSILDGRNREISMKLTDVRRPGCPVYNDQNLPAANSFYSFSCIQNQQRKIRVLEDGQDGSIYDITGGIKVNVFSKSGTDKTRFLGVANELFFSDGIDLKAWLTPAPIWKATTAIAPGTLINAGVEPYNLQMALGGLTMNIVATSSDGTFIYVYIDPEGVPAQFPNLDSVHVTFSGLTLATSLNGNTYAARMISSTLGILRITQAQGAYVQAADTGQGTTGTGITGGSAPSFSGTKYVVTADGGQQWKCYGPAVLDWGLATPTKAPVLTAANGARWWQPGFTTTADYCILDSNQNVQIVLGSGQITGKRYPIWAAISTTSVGITNDGTAQWYNLGKIGGWAASSPFYTFPSGATGGTGTSVILDSNGNLQWVTNGGGGNSGSSEPTWATSVGTTTSDGALTWTCLGPGTTLTTASIQYAFSTHGVDGSVSTASPAATVNGPILGPNITTARNSIFDYLTLTCILPTFPSLDQTDYINIWRTPQGQLGTLILEDQISLDNSQVHISPPYPFQVYQELGIPDTSTDGNGALNAFILAPTAKANTPPPAGATAPTYHLNRVWMILGNSVIYSGGPDTVVGNGNTTFPPLNSFGFQGVPIRLVPVTVQNGGLLVYTTAGIFIILGTGTSSNGFYATTYYDKVILAGYDALDTLGNAHFLMESNLKVSTIAIEYPFNPQGGYTEIGFPIGDQFLKVTTGGYSSSLYTAAGTFLSWNIANTTDTGMYVADGAVGWFRMSNAAPPENGLIWSPHADIGNGTSAVQSIETAPGVFNVLIGPPAGGTGPVLMRDTTGTAFFDGPNTEFFPAFPYPSWDVKGVTLLCTTGQVSELAWIATKSTATGKRPTVGILMNEIAPTPDRPFTILQATNQDPANLPASLTAYSDVYNCMQNGAPLKGDCVSLKFDYGLQKFGDELLDFQIYGRKDDFRLSAAGG